MCASQTAGVPELQYVGRMREYSYQATEASIEALRRLQAPWVSIAATEHEIAVTTAEGAVVLISAERAEVEDTLDVMRLRADLVTPDDAALADAAELPVEDLGKGRNDVVLFTGETWMEDGAGLVPANGSSAPQMMQFSGKAGQRSPAATMVCTTTDSLVVAASTGEGMLIRLGVRPLSLVIVRSRIDIARFLVQRGYTASDDPR